MDGRRGFSITPRLVLGVCIITLGVVLLLDQMQVVEAGSILRFWPVVLIVVGLVKLLRPAAVSSRAAGALFLIAGSLILLHTLDLVDVHWHVLWPLVLVFLGSWIVIRAVAGRPGGKPSAGAVDSSSTFSSLSIMAGVDHKNASKEFRGGEATAIMGGCEIDLRDATIAGEEAVIDLFAMWGGIDIIVPGDWTIVISATPLMGGVEDSRKSVGSDPTKRLVVKGLVIMGGVEIRN